MFLLERKTNVPVEELRGKLVDVLLLDEVERECPAQGQRVKVVLGADSQGAQRDLQLL